MNFNKFILLANFFPEDLTFDVIPRTTNVFLIYGIHDEFLTEERILAVKKQLADSSMNCKVITFDGRHDVPKEVLIRETEINGWS